MSCCPSSLRDPWRRGAQKHALLCIATGSKVPMDYRVSEREAKSLVVCEALLAAGADLDAKNHGAIAQDTAAHCLLTLPQCARPS